MITVLLGLATLQASYPRSFIIRLRVKSDLRVQVPFSASCSGPTRARAFSEELVHPPYRLLRRGADLGRMDLVARGDLLDRLVPQQYLQCPLRVEIPVKSPSCADSHLPSGGGIHLRNLSSPFGLSTGRRTVTQESASA